MGDVEEPDPLADGGVLGEHPAPAYSIGIDQPPKSASLAPAATWRSCEGRGGHSRGGRYGPRRIESVPPTISATDHPLEKLTGDAVVVAVGKGPDGLLPTPGAEAVDRLLGGRLLPALADLGARGAEDEVTRLPSFGQGPFAVVAVAGLGAPEANGSYRARGRPPRRRSGRPRAGRPALGGHACSPPSAARPTPSA